MFGFSIRKILPHIYHLRFESAYELAMHFVRFQEYYESPKYYKQIFTLVDYMEWYAKDRGKGSFSYPVDWSGFNVPSWVLQQVRKADIRDLNKYDRLMFTLIDRIHEQEHPHNYYLIGTSIEGVREDIDEEDTLDHEIAHGLYAVNRKYGREVGSLLAQWGYDFGHKSEELVKARKVLREMGYHVTTVDDEIHAYCATGLCETLKGVISKQEMKPFQTLFREVKKKCLNAKSK